MDPVVTPKNSERKSFCVDNGISGEIKGRFQSIFTGKYLEFPPLLGCEEGGTLVKSIFVKS